MSATPSRVANRLAHGLKNFQSVLVSAKDRDVNESDTVIIVTGLLSELFGYDKYSEVTSEVSIRGSYCDLATKVGNEVHFLVEVKAIGSELKEGHTRQAVDYAANQGAEWVVLTNGAVWRIYKVVFSKPVEAELIIEVDLLALDPKSAESVDSLYLLTKEGFRKSALAEYDAQRQALSRFCVAALLRSDAVVQVVRRELRRMAPGVKIEPEQVRAVLEREVLKRDVLDGDRAEEARRKVNKALAKSARHKPEPEIVATAATEATPAPAEQTQQAAAATTKP